MSETPDVTSFPRTLLFSMGISIKAGQSVNISQDVIAMAVKNALPEGTDMYLSLLAVGSGTVEQVRKKNVPPGRGTRPIPGANERKDNG